MTDAPTPEVSDDALMRQFCAGDERAFDEIYRRHAAGIHSFLRRLVGNPALAEDVFQTTFLSFVRARGRYEMGTSLRGWLFAIAANAGRDALRRAVVRRETGRSDDDFANHAAPDAPLPDPAAARALNAALGKLSPEKREAVLLHKLHGFSFEEVASALGISVSAAKVRAHRGYEQLRVLLAHLETEFR